MKGSEDAGFMGIAGNLIISIKELCTHNLNQKIEALLYCGV